MSTQDVDQDPVIVHLMGQARSAVNEIEAATAAGRSPSITDGRLLIQAFRTLEDLLAEGWRLPVEWQTVNGHRSGDEVSELVNEMHAAGAAATAAAAIDPDDADLDRVANAFVALDEALSAGASVPLRWVIGADDI